MLDTYINKFHVGSHVGQNIINYTYKPTFGYLNSIKSYTLNDVERSLDCSFENMIYSRNVKQSNKEGITGLNKQKNPFDSTAKRNFTTQIYFNHTYRVIGKDTMHKQHTLHSGVT